MTRPLAPSTIAAALARLAGCSPSEAARRLGVTRQAVHDAAQRLARGRRQGGRRKSTDPTRSITVGDWHVKLTESQIARFTAAVGSGSLATWLRVQAAKTPRREDETISGWIRRAAEEEIARVDG